MQVTRHSETFNQNVAFLPDKSDLRSNQLHSGGRYLYLRNKAHVCEYYTKYDEANNTVNVLSLYKDFFPNYEIIGTTDFTGHYENPRLSAGFAYNIGADILLTAHSLVSKADRVSVVPDFWTGINTAYYTDYKFKQEGLFLRKKDDNTENIWLQTEKTFPRDVNQDSLTGIYENDFYSLNLYSSGQYLVAILNEESSGTVLHNRNFTSFEINEDSFFPKYDFLKGEVKFYFNKNTMTGVYLRSDRCPVSAVFIFSKDNKELIVKRSFDSEQSHLTFKKNN